MSKKNKKIITLGLEILVILAFGLITFTALKANAYNYADRDEREYFQNAPAYIPFKQPLGIQAVQPNSINTLERETKIIIKGSGFNGSSIVTIDGSPRPTTFINPSHLMIKIYPSEIPSNQSEFFITVRNRNPEEYSNSAKFTIKSNAINPVRSTAISTNTNTFNSSTSTYIKNTNTSNSTSDINNKINVTKDDVNESYGELSANVLRGSGSFMPSGAMQWIFAIVIVLAIIILWRYVHRSEEKYMAQPMKHA